MKTRNTTIAGPTHESKKTYDIKSREVSVDESNSLSPPKEEPDSSKLSSISHEGEITKTKSPKGKVNNTDRRKFFFRRKSTVKDERGAI
jgi:hypothetical protein